MVSESTPENLPDFLIVGAPKAGTTALHDALKQHPDLFLTHPKEPKYFLTGGSRPRRENHRGPGDAHSSKEWIWQRDRYEALFADAPRGSVRGESTPFYLWDLEAHARLKATVPDVKMIVVLRDPIDRAYSNWTHLWCDGLEPERDFGAACEREEDRIRDGYAPFWRYLDLGRYGAQLSHLYEHFDRERVQVLRYRQLIDSPAATLNSIAEFLGVSGGSISRIPPSNVTPWVTPSRTNLALQRTVRAGARAGAYFPPKAWRRASRPLLAALHRSDLARPAMDPRVRERLIPRIADDVAVLQELTGESYDDWLDGEGPVTYTVRRS